MDFASRNGGDPAATSHWVWGSGRGRWPRRRISPEAGHALEILGHAIEYLADEFIHSGESLSGHDAQVEAVQILMRLNRQVYFSCPEVPEFRERLRAMLHFRAVREKTAHTS